LREGLRNAHGKGPVIALRLVSVSSIGR